MTTTSKTRAVVLLGAAFLLGAVAGGFGMKMTGKSGRRDRGPDRCEVRHRMVCGWADALQLTTEQQEAMLAVYRGDEPGLDSIFGQIRPQTDSLYDLIRPAVDSHRMAFREKLRPLLTPEQREKYDSVNTFRDEERRQMRERTAGGPGGPGGPPRGRP